jgi:hypothetical protein
MMNLLWHYGRLELSEELCLGIGGGLGFTYSRALNSDMFMVFGRSDDLEINLCDMFGIYLKPMQDYDTERSWERVCTELTHGRPVLADVDISKLAYVRSRLTWPEFSSHGGHKIVIAGYRPEMKEVVVNDYAWTNTITLSRDEFFRAWKTDTGIYPARNLWFSFYLPHRILPVDNAIKRGIQLNVYRMLAPWSKLHGIHALKAFLREVPNWQFVMSKEQLRKVAHAVYVALEVAGNGKGAFRRMYARFLKESAIQLQQEELHVIAEQYVQLANWWSELAARLKEGSLDPDKGIFSGDAENERFTAAIYRAEESAIHRLKEVADRWKREKTAIEDSRGA